MNKPFINNFPIQKTICFILTFFSIGNSFAYASTTQIMSSAVVNTVISLNIDSGIVSGDRTGYQLNLPEETIRHLKVERVLIRDKNAIVEKVNYYCCPPSKKYKPALLFTFYVFYKSKWSDDYLLTPIMTTKDYIYAVRIYDEIPFDKKDVEDRQIFRFLLKKLGNIESIRNCINLSKDQKVFTENTLLVNGEILEEKVHVIDSVYYLPIRSVCEQLGYVVKWNQNTSSIFLSKKDFSDSFYIANNKKIPNGGKIMIIENRAYVSSHYFLKNLNCVIEVDKEGNLNVISN